MPEKKAKSYLEEAEKYRLGELLTEQLHSETMDLSKWAKSDLPQALNVLKKIELDAVSFLLEKSELLKPLKESIENTLKENGKIFLCGCGATGRLSLSLETIWREKNRKNNLENQVVSFMAGGDIALIRSIESFEDRKDFGERQLRELGFSENDLFLGITEGGETTFVIGATEVAKKISKRKPFFLHCNPTETLTKKIKRSEEIINNSDIHDISFPFGPMSLSGSTRLQASTVLMLAVASCLMSKDQSIFEYINDFKNNLSKLEINKLESFVEKESNLYEDKKSIIYSTNNLGITILTDTTERSPTFSLSAFENFDEIQSKSFVEKRSLSYLHLKETTNAVEAWNKLLFRHPRTLDWEEFLRIAGPDKINGYDFSEQVFIKRPTGQILFSIDRNDKDEILWKLDGLEEKFSITDTNLETQHLLLKVLLNIHSTLLMGRLDRYEGNCMTWVKPSNGKLVDRATRYIQNFCQKEGLEFTYEEIVHQLFVDFEDLKPNEAIVLKVLASLKKI